MLSVSSGRWANQVHTTEWCGCKAQFERIPPKLGMRGMANREEVHVLSSSIMAFILSTVDPLHVSLDIDEHVQYVQLPRKLHVRFTTKMLVGPTHFLKITSAVLDPVKKTSSFPLACSGQRAFLAKSANDVAVSALLGGIRGTRSRF